MEIEASRLERLTDNESDGERENGAKVNRNSVTDKKRNTVNTRKKKITMIAHDTVTFYCHKTAILLVVRIENPTYRLTDQTHEMVAFTLSEKSFLSGLSNENLRFKSMEVTPENLKLRYSG